MEPEWEFLVEWFRVLQDVATIAERCDDEDDERDERDVVRLGREEDEERWIDVYVDIRPLKPQDPVSLHEALVLTSMLAVADPDAWRVALEFVCGLDVPVQLQPRYRFGIADPDWTRVPLLLAPDRLSERFREHYAMVKEVARSRGVDLADETQFPVQARNVCGLVDRTEQVRHLRTVTDALVAIQDKTAQPCGRATLRLDAIEAEYRACEMHSEVFTSILELVETGIPICSLSLPIQLGNRYNQHDAAEWNMVWSLLVSAVCGRPQRPTRRPTRVDKLSLDSKYHHPRMLIPLLSVLRLSRTLKSLTIPSTLKHTDPCGLFWSWLGYALFRPDSRCPVEVLNVEPGVLSSSAMTKMRTIVSSPNPLTMLWQMATQSEVNTTAETTHREIVVPAGSIVTPHASMSGRSAASFELAYNWSGVVVRDDATKTTVDVLLEGIGFCQVERSSLPNKRQRVGSPRVVQTDTRSKGQSSVRTLHLAVVRNNDNGSGAPHDACRVESLVDIVGRELTSLSLSDYTADDQLIDRCLKKCPNLQNLRLVGCRLTTMDPIIQSYDRGGKILSLELSAIQVQPAFLPRFEAFLSELLTPSAMKRTLKKLHIGYQWAALFRQSTADVLKQVLDDPLTLDYLHVYRCENPRVAPSIDWDIATHNGERIPVAGTPPLATRVAFMSVIKHLGTRDVFVQLDDEAIALVFEYIGQTKSRVVISVSDPNYISRRSV